jgi:DNA-binding NarL/FixJ family response regulator
VDSAHRSANDVARVATPGHRALAPIIKLPLAADRGHGAAPVRVLLAEDNLLVREGIGTLIDRHDDLAVVARCGDLDTLLEKVERYVPHVVVTDIRMPPGHSDEGIRAAAHLREVRPSIGVIVLSQYVAPAYALSLLDGGAAGRAYLLKDSVAELDQLPAAIRTVAAGGSVIDAAVVDALVGTPRQPGPSDIDQLTDREREVLSEIAKGKSNAAIGAALYLGERAVEKHINSILSKLGLFADPGINRRVTVALRFLAAGHAVSR